MNIPTGRNSYCGPFAIAAIVGSTTDDAARVVRAFTGRTAIKWMNVSEVRKALFRRGYDCHRRDYTKATRPTLGQWINNTFKPDTDYIVLVTGHYLVIRNNRVACSQSHEWVKLDDVDGKRRRVVAVLELTY